MFLKKELNHGELVKLFFVMGAGNEPFVVQNADDFYGYDVYIFSAFNNAMIRMGV